MHRCALPLVALLAAPALHAHDTYFLTDGWEAEPGTNVRLLLNSASTFPVLEYGPAPDRIVERWVRAGSGPEFATAELVTGERTESWLALRTRLPTAGEVAVAVTFGPRDIDLEAESVEHYFEEISPGDAVRAAYGRAEDGVLREQYTKHAKALLCAVPCPAGGAASRPLGQALEFVALAETAEADGSPGTRAFRLLARGEPLAAAPVNFWTADGVRTALLTDDRGRITIPLDVPGPALLSSVDLRAPVVDGARFESDFTALTFRIAKTE